MNVLIYGAGNSIAISIARYLYQNGHRAILADSRKYVRAFYSKYCEKKYLFRNPDYDKEGFSADLKNCIQKEGVQLLLPTWDKGLFDLIDVKESIPRVVKVLCPMDYGKISYVVNKKNIPAISEKADIDVVPSFIIDEKLSMSDVESIAPPYALKLEYGVSGEGFKKADSLKDLEKKIKKIKSQGLQKKYLIQKYISGPVYGAGGIFENNELKRFFSYKYIRRHPCLAGNSTVRIVDLKDSIREAMSKVLKVLQWEGFCHMDFVISGENQRPYLLDINPVHWYSVPASVSRKFNCLSYYLDKSVSEGNVKNEDRDMYATISIIRECQRIATGGMFKKVKPSNDIGYQHYIKALRYSDFYWDPLPILLAPLLKLIRSEGVRKKQKELIC